MTSPGFRSRKQRVQPHIYSYQPFEFSNYALYLRRCGCEQFRPPRICQEMNAQRKENCESTYQTKTDIVIRNNIQCDDGYNEQNSGNDHAQYCHRMINLFH